MYDVRSECPKTCLNQDGDYDCGDTMLVEGCFCKDGFVENDKGKCVEPKDCGPRPCTDSENNCGVGAICQWINDEPVCSCKPGTNGDPNIRCCGKCFRPFYYLNYFY